MNRRWNITTGTAACALWLAGAGAVRSAVDGGSDWPQWRGPNRDGVSTETGWTAHWGPGGPKELWNATVGKGFSSCAVAAGRVYTLGNAGGQDTLWCFDAGSGRQLWTHRYAAEEGKHPGPRATPTVDGDRVYSLSRHGHLFCLGAADGKVRWATRIEEESGARQTKYGWGFACSPLVLDDLLVLDLGKVVALDKNTGKIAWTSRTPDEAGFASATVTTIAGQPHVLSFNRTGLVAVNARDGAETARFPWETDWWVNSADPIPCADGIFISSGYDRGCALLKLVGGKLEAAYEHKEMRNHCNPCVLYQGHLYGFDGQQGRNGALKCLDPATGKARWAQEGLKVGALMIAGGRIVAMLDGGTLLVAEADPAGYRELGRAQVLNGQCWTVPVLSHGRVYCRSNAEGRLACVDVARR